MDLSPFILKAQCECLNECDDHPFEHCLTSNGGYLQSDCDEQVGSNISNFVCVLINCSKKFINKLYYFQLIISIAFNQSVKIHSLKITAPADKGPKNIKIFINQPRTLDFDLADSYTSVQDLT